MGAKCCSVDFGGNDPEGKAPANPAKPADPDLEEEEDNSDDEVDDIPPPSKNYGKSRKSVSAEVYGKYNQKVAFTPLVIRKSEAQKERIRIAISTSFLFSGLDAKDLDVVIDAFREVLKSPGTEVITQFDEGADCLYLIEVGQLSVSKRKNKAEPHPGTHIFTYIDSGVFGELALLYDCPRAATVRAETECVLWSIDRETFNQVVKDAAQRKRDLYDSFVQTVSILQNLDPYERSKLCDALKVREYKAGDLIIREGDVGDEFFIVEQGAVIAVKGEQEVMQYGPSSYFGELSLLRDEPRAATVIAKSNSRVLALDRSSFKRLLGPLDSILAERARRLYEESKMA